MLFGKVTYVVHKHKQYTYDGKIVCVVPLGHYNHIYVITICILWINDFLPTNTSLSCARHRFLNHGIKHHANFVRRLTTVKFCTRTSRRFYFIGEVNSWLNDSFFTLFIFVHVIAKRQFDESWGIMWKIFLSGKGNKVKPVRSFGAYIIVRASTEAKNLVSFFPREKQINASRRRDEAPPIDLSLRFRRRDAATPRRDCTRGVCSPIASWPRHPHWGLEGRMNGQIVFKAEKSSACERIPTCRAITLRRGNTARWKIESGKLRLANFQRLQVFLIVYDQRGSATS